MSDEQAKFTELFQGVSNADIERTHKGQIHFAGGGPKGKTCRQCALWAGGERYEKGGGAKYQKYELKPAICRPYKGATGDGKAQVPHRAGACKYFEPADNPPDPVRNPTLERQAPLGNEKAAKDEADEGPPVEWYCGACCGVVAKDEACPSCGALEGEDRYADG